MARKARYTLTGVPQHLIQRGNNRAACFYADDDYRFYLDCLGDAARNTGCDLHAYVLMTNHVHLLVTPREQDSLSRLMQSVGRRYVQYINYTYQRTGTLWEGRYKASLIDSERYFLTCSRYIELNPVRAAMVNDPGDYRWSSYRRNAHGEADVLITPYLAYQRLGWTDAERQAAYRALFGTHIDTQTLTAIRDAANQNRVLGDDRFIEQIETMLQRKLTPGRRGRPRKQEPNDYRIEEGYVVYA